MTSSPFIPTLADLQNFRTGTSWQCAWTTKAKGSPQCKSKISATRYGNILKALILSLNDDGVEGDLHETLASISRILLCGARHESQYHKYVLDVLEKEVAQQSTMVPDMDIALLLAESTGLPESLPAALTKALDEDAPEMIKATFTPVIEEEKAFGQLINSVTPALEESAFLPQSTISPPLTEALPPPEAVVTSALNGTPPDLYKRLGIDDRQPSTCHGQAGKWRTCGNVIGKRKRKRIDNIVFSLAQVRTFSDPVKLLLQELSTLVLCSRHQDQAEFKQEVWEETLMEFYRALAIENSAILQGTEGQSVRQTPVRPIKYRTRSSVAASENDSPDSIRSDLWSTGGRTASTTLSMSDTSFAEDYDMPSPLSRKSKRPDPEMLATDLLAPVLSATAALASTTGSKNSAISAEVMYQRYNMRSEAESLAALREKTLLPLSERDRKEGFIYVYRRVSDKYLKIGASNDLEKRFAAIKRECRYQPQLLQSVRVQNNFRLERLVQLTLDRERRKEILVDKRCNAGEGCHKEHGEFFEVGLEHAMTVINMWKGWIEQIPYDDSAGYVLKTSWAHQLMNKKSDWRHVKFWLKWTSPILMKEEGKPVIVLQKKEKVATCRVKDQITHQVKVEKKESFVVFKVEEVTSQVTDQVIYQVGAEKKESLVVVKVEEVDPFWP